MNTEEVEYLRSIRDAHEMLIFDHQGLCEYLARALGFWDALTNATSNTGRCFRAVPTQTPTHFLMFIQFTGSSDDGLLMLVCSKTYWNKERAAVEFGRFLDFVKSPAPKTH